MARVASVELMVTLASLVLLAVHNGEALKCYACSSINPLEKCGDPFNATAHTADTCDLSTALCLKQNLPSVGKYPESTHRGCVEESYCKNYESTSKHCSICKTDFCNSAYGLSIPSVSVLLMLYFCIHIFKNISASR